MFSGEPEADTAGDQECHPGAGIQEIAHLRSRGDHLLDVIQDQQQAPVGQNADEAVVQRLGTHVAQPKCAGDSGNDMIRVENRGEIDEDDTVRKRVKDGTCGRDGEAGLADATRTGQRQKSYGGVTQHRNSGGQLLVARDQGRQRDREVRASTFRGGGRHQET